MTTISVPSAPGQPGDQGLRVSPRRLATRRRLLLLGCLLLLLAVALAANYGPIRRYQDARARLEKTTAGITALEKQEAELQSQLRKLGQAQYVEGLAREELSFARPGEDLYIITGFAGGVSAKALPGAGSAESADAIGSAVSGLDDDMASADAASDETEAEAAGRPGLLERMLSAISGLF